jgi:D-amino-acid dehydrogenase
MARHEIKGQILNVEQLVQQEPALRASISELVGGIYYEGDEHGNAASYVSDLAGKLEQDGVTVKLGCEITGFVREGGAITHVKTDDEILDCDAVVIAAGNVSRSLVQSLGLSLPIQPVKGNSITYDASSWEQAPKIPVVDDAYHIAVTPLGDTVRIVGTAEFCGADTTVRPERMELLRRSALKLYPEISEVLENQKPLQEWAGLRPMTPDCLPILGQAGADNLYLNTGHSYLGWTTAAGTARMIADAISNRQSGLDISPYELSRFQ